MSDLIALARRHKHIAPTHYEGCEADHIGCLVNKLADDIERLRADRRERIATAALNGLIANAVVAHTPDVLALAAVVIADAMIAELDKDEGKP